MAVGIDTACAKIIDIVRAISPIRTPDAPFVCEEDAGGQVEPIEERLSGGHYRLFALRMSGAPEAQDAGGGDRRYFRADLDLVVVYAMKPDPEAVRRMIAEDSASLTTALCWTVSNYDTANSGIDTIDIVGTTLETAGPEAADDDTAFLATWQLEVLYREVGA